MRGLVIPRPTISSMLYRPNRQVAAGTPAGRRRVGGEKGTIEMGQRGVLNVARRRTSGSRTRHPERFVADPVARSSLVPDGLRVRLLRAVGHSFDPSVTIRAGVRFGGHDIHLDRDVHIGVDSLIESPCHIGPGSTLAPRVVVLAYTHEIGPSDDRAVDPPVVSAVQIGRGCWIGAAATILPGVCIGDGVVIAAGAVVTTDCLDDGLYAGVPARRIRDLD